MRSLLVAALGLLLLVPAPARSAPMPDPDDVARPAPPERAGNVRLGGVRVDLRRGTRQVVTVNHRRGHHARVRYWTLRRGHWRERMDAADGRIGYGGLVPRGDRRQGTGTTPLGTFGLPFAFGMHRQDDAWDLRYRKVRRGDYWVQDNASDHYNRYRNKRQGGFRWWLPVSDPDSSERLLDYRGQYEWAIVMDFNWRQVRHRGAGIFLHVNGAGATAGCVSAPRWFVRKLMRKLDPDRVPVIAVGR
jgi:L,D-peptidoglycan transpeptidase YkuD (ErfK/YbiS/YcfS/YnhG family)